jgi:hypothetical protein
MRLPDMNNLGRVIKGGVTALGCLIFAMMFFVGVIALSDYSVAQSHNEPGAAEGTTLAEVIALLAFVGGGALLVWIVRGRFKRAGADEDDDEDPPAAGATPWAAAPRRPRRQRPHGRRRSH